MQRNKTKKFIHFPCLYGFFLLQLTEFWMGVITNYYTISFGFSSVYNNFRLMHHDNDVNEKNDEHVCFRIFKPEKQILLVLGTLRKKQISIIPLYAKAFTRTTSIIFTIFHELSRMMHSSVVRIFIHRVKYKV